MMKSQSAVFCVLKFGPDFCFHSSIHLVYGGVQRQDSMKFTKSKTESKSLSAKSHFYSFTLHFSFADFLLAWHGARVSRK